LFLSFKNTLQDFIVFTPNDIHKFFPKFDKKNLVNWQKKGYIKRIRNNYYCFSDIQKSEDFLFYVANAIYNPSYISLESALSFYAIIPEGVYSITSVSTLKTNEFDTDFTRFTYRNVKPNLYFGYRLLTYQNQSFKIASPEKTILDYLYLNPHIKDAADFEELRWNKLELLTINLNLLDDYMELFDSNALNQRVVYLKTYINALV
jgi:predicted transcriptional regulator of viral defense system